MSYTVLARRYRSTSFKQVIGQQPIAQTLQNAIASDRVAHAFLFTGTRGVGKTSMARIFARALNAPTTIPDCPVSSSKNTTYPPEDIQSRMGQSIMRGDDLNVIEIDGASNNRVDDVRDLIAKASLAPTQDAPYKIYIIDEVHMLSTGAFNALLKTMEEPPSHVKFILCTTETHKVPATIQSRCQRFDFKNIPTQDIANHLTSVIESEGVKTDDQTTFQIARLGNGSMRDALSLLDRIIATGQNPINQQLLEQMLGLPSQDLIDQLIDGIAQGSARQTLQNTHELLTKGIAQDQLLDTLIQHFRQLMLISACGIDSQLVELAQEAKTKAQAQAKQFDAASVVYIIALCENLQRTSKQSANPRALLDAAMVRLALSEKMADVTQLLKDQKKNLTPPPGIAPPISPPANKTPSTTQPKPIQAAPQPTPQVFPHTPQSTTQTQPIEADASSEQSPFNDSEPSPFNNASPPAQTSYTPSPTPVTPCDGDIPHASPELLSDKVKLWAAILSLIATKPALKAWLSKLTLTNIDNTTATLSPLPGQKDISKFASQDRQKNQIAAQIRDLTGKILRIQIIDNIDHSNAPTNTSAAQKKISKADQQEALNLPLVQQLRDMFDLTFVNVTNDNNQGA